MSVLHPGLAAAALASVLVPILIHLLLRRRKRVIRWAAMDLLERAMRRDRRRRRVERWLLLAARCLLLVVAGLAIARPVADLVGGAATGSRSRTLWIVIDDGITGAERLPDGGSALERHVAEARRAVAMLSSGDRVGLIAAAEPVRRLVDPPTADLTRVESFLATLEPASTGSNLAQALHEAAAAARETETGAVDVLLLSSFRRGSLDVASAAPALAESWPRSTRLFASTVPTTSSDNAFVAGVEALRRGDDAGLTADRPLRVQIERRGGLARTSRRVTAHVSRPADAGAAAPTAADRAGAGIEAVDLSLDSGERGAGVELRLRGAGVASDASPSAALNGDGTAVEIELDADAQPFDDRLYAVLPPERAPRVVVLDRLIGAAHTDLERLSSGAWMARAVDPGRGSRVQVDEIDPGSLDRAVVSRSEVVIVARPDLVTPEGWELLAEFVDDGGALIVAPAPDGSAQRWVERFRARLAPTWRIDPEPETAAALWRLAAQQAPSAMLRMLGSELSALAAPVSATRRLRLEAPASDAEAPLVFEDEAPFLLAGRAPSQRGWVVLLSTAPALDWTDLPVRPLMVPLMQELVRQGRELARSDEAALAGSRITAPRGAALLVRRDGAAAGGASAVSLAVGPDGRTREIAVMPGIYDAVDERGRRVGAVAVNVDPRRADIEPNDPAAVRAWLQPVGAWAVPGDDTPPVDVSARDEGSRWSVVLFAIAAAIALAEMVLGRVLSRPAVAELAA